MSTTRLAPGSTALTPLTVGVPHVGADNLDVLAIRQVRQVVDDGRLVPVGKQVDDCGLLDVGEDGPVDLAQVANCTPSRASSSAGSSIAAWPGWIRTGGCGRTAGCSKPACSSSIWPSWDSGSEDFKHALKLLLARGREEAGWLDLQEIANLAPTCWIHCMSNDDSHPTTNESRLLDGFPGRWICVQRVRVCRILTLDVSLIS